MTHISVTHVAVTHVSVAIIGAGFAGIGAAIELRRAGEESFLLLERGSQVGGTWRDNTYPGVACDVPSHLYTFSFRPNPGWSRLFAPGREIRDYLELAVDEEGLRPHLRLGTAMTGMHWDDDAALWRISTNSGVVTADAVILACGRLTEPRIPELPGLETFRGEITHTARWRDEVDFAGTRVAVIGTGASAVQLVPHLAAVTDELVVFQRNAPWVVPRADRAYTAEERDEFAAEPTLIDRLRDTLFTEGESMFPARVGESTASAGRGPRSPAPSGCGCHTSCRPHPRLRDRLQASADLERLLPDLHDRAGNPRTVCSRPNRSGHAGRRKRSPLRG